MTIAAKPAIQLLLRGLAWLLFLVAALSFWVGGRVISDFGKVDRILAEFLGLSVAGATGLLGYILKESVDDGEDGADSSDRQ